MNEEIFLSSDEEEIPNQVVLRAREPSTTTRNNPQVRAEQAQNIRLVSLDCVNPSSALPLNNLQKQQPCTNKLGLEALKSYRDSNKYSSGLPTIIDVRSLAAETGNTASHKVNKKSKAPHGRLKRLISCEKSIEESIEECVKGYSYPDAEPLQVSCSSGTNNDQDPLSLGPFIENSQTSSEEVSWVKDVPTVGVAASVAQGTAPAICPSSNSLLFSELIRKCAALEDNVKDREKAEGKLRSHHGKARSDFLESSQFADIISLQMTKLNRDTLYACIRDVLDVLKMNKVIRRVPLQPAPSTSASPPEKTDSSSTRQHPDELLKINVASVRDVEKVAKLHNALESLKKKITVLEETEVEWDDELDSNYIKMQRYRERFAKIYAELSKLTAVPKHANRASKRKVRFDGTKYPEANILIERWLNRTGCFPDFNDVVGILKGLDLGLTQVHLQTIAQGAFLAIGEHLQKRRKRELWDILGEQYAGTDPAAQDATLSSKLDENQRLFHGKERELLDSFVQKQLELARQDNPTSQESEQADEDSQSEDDRIINGVSSDGENETLKEIDGKSDIENMDVAGVPTAVASNRPAAKRKRTASSDEPQHKNDSQKGHQVTACRPQQAENSCSVIELNFFVIKKTYYPPHAFAKILKPCWIKHDKVLREYGKQRMKLSTRRVKWEKNRKCKRPYLEMKDIVIIRNLWNESTGRKLRGDGAVTNGSGSGSEGSSPSASGSSSPSAGPQSHTQSTSPPTGGASGDRDDKDDDDGKKKKQDDSSLGNLPDDVDDEENEDEESELENTEVIDNDLPEKEKTEVIDNDLPEKEANGDDEALTDECMKELEASREEGKTDGDISAKEIITSDENVPASAPCDSQGGNDVEGRQKERQLRIRNARVMKPKWIDNGEESETSSEQSEETDSQYDDPDFTVSSPTKTSKQLKFSVEPKSNASNSQIALTTVTSHERNVVPEKPTKEPKLNSTDCSVAASAAAEEEDSDDIEVISENIVKKPQTITPQDRVSSFLANASKFAITVTRKRPMSRETKEALTQLKKLKNINISSARLDKSEVIVVNDVSRGESSGLPPRRHSTIIGDTTAPATATPSTRHTPYRLGRPGARSSRGSRLPVISSVQGFRNSSPMITGVRGAHGARFGGRQLSRGRSRGPRPAMGMMGAATVRGMGAIGPRPTLPRGIRGTSRGRGLRGVARRPAAAAPSTSVPFVLLD